MTTILAVADEVDEVLYGEAAERIRPDLVVSCGDLPFDFLEFLVTRLSVPLVYVPGNHDPDLHPQRGAAAWPPQPSISYLEDPPGPLGGTNADIHVVDEAGVRMAGLGGSIRYRDGPNQYTQAQMRRRARRLRRRAAWREFRDGREVDVVLSHAPPLGLGDDDDPAHVGIEALLPLARRLRPAFLLHGHIHPYGRELPDRAIGPTRVVNVVPFKVLELEA